MLWCIQGRVKGFCNELWNGAWGWATKPLSTAGACEIRFKSAFNANCQGRSHYMGLGDSAGVHPKRPQTKTATDYNGHKVIQNGHIYQANGKVIGNQFFFIITAEMSTS